ncbi:hypothetical protein EDC04DRAFT_2610570 [Pisolithus marmoratus]|nr:hypothetical protein EDC04DRAFT_2610570 [Pisolithus marmoratus]
MPSGGDGSQIQLQTSQFHRILGFHSPGPVPAPDILKAQWINMFFIEKLYSSPTIRRPPFLASLCCNIPTTTTNAASPRRAIAQHPYQYYATCPIRQWVTFGPWSHTIKALNCSAHGNVLKNQCRQQGYGVPHLVLSRLANACTPSSSWCPRGKGAETSIAALGLSDEGMDGSESHTKARIEVIMKIMALRAHADDLETLFYYLQAASASELGSPSKGSSHAHASTETVIDEEEVVPALMVGAFSKFATEELTAFGVYSQPDFREDGGHKRREVTRVCCATNCARIHAMGLRHRQLPSK